jgi:predicted nucleotidyltransferase
VTPSEVIETIARHLQEDPRVEGVFLGGSLATSGADECSDVDLGVTAGNTEEECRNVYDLWPSLAQALGEPLTVEASYRVEPSQGLTMLRGLYLGCLREIPESRGMTPDLDRLKAALDALP